MLKQTGTIIAVLGVAFNLALAAPAESTTKPAGEYQIKLHRPETVGSRYQYSVTGSAKKDTTMSVAGQAVPTPSEVMAFEVSGIKEVTKVDKQGRPTGITFTIAKCVQVEGDKKTEVAPKGTVVLATYENDHKNITAKDASVTLSDEALQILHLVIDVSTAKEGEGDDDDSFGTKDKKKVGDTWPVHADAVVKQMGSQIGQGATLHKDDVTGQTKLAAVKTVQGVDCLEVQCNMTISNFKPPVPPLLGDIKVTSGKIAVALTGLFPVDLVSQPVNSTQSETMTFEMTGTNGKNPISIKVNATSVLSITETKIAKD